MNLTENVEYYLAQSYFKEAEDRGQKLISGSMDASIWLHKEKINLDFVIETAKNFSDSRIFIISEGEHKGFYIYSNDKKDCLKLISSHQKIKQAETV
ncbi:MAG TPA: hypothetical protein VJY41_06685 [Prolixibacteraceae bacterium]|nr:hypothetical protein [Prolixibacteraceae bacterium]